MDSNQVELSLILKQIIARLLDRLDAVVSNPCFEFNHTQEQVCESLS